MRRGHQLPGPRRAGKGYTSTNAAVNKADAVTPGLRLGLPDQARTVTVGDGSMQVTDGPYLGDVSRAAEYFIVDADSIAAAVENAFRIPAARHGRSAEIRPVATCWWTSELRTTGPSAARRPVDLQRKGFRSRVWLGAERRFSSALLIG